MKAMKVFLKILSKSQPETEKLFQTSNFVSNLGGFWYKTPVNDEMRNEAEK